MSYKNHIDHELMYAEWGLQVDCKHNCSYCSATVELMSPELLLASGGAVASQFTTLPLATASASVLLEEGVGAGQALLAHGCSLLTALSTTAA